MKFDSKNSMYWCVFLVATIGVLFNVQIVQSIGVTRPVPYDIELMKGESAGFTFEIQAVTSTERLLCTYSISGLDALEINFEEDDATVDAGSIKNVYGTITAPVGAEIKTYSGHLSVSCGPVVEGAGSGSVVKTTVGGSPFNIKVVEVREKGIREISPPPGPGIDYTTILIAVLIIIIVIIVLYYNFKAKKGK